MSENQNRRSYFRRFMHSPLAGFLPVAGSLSQDKETEALLRHMMRESRKQAAVELSKRNSQM